MARVVAELTNRCNLRCRHCFEQRHAATSDLPLAIVEKVLAEGKQCGIDHLTFTGGEPTLHDQFEEIVRRVCDAGYTFSFVSNGSTLPEIYPLLVRNRQAFKGATFSLDGARQQTHDRLRGKGSFRQVMRAASVCVFNELPFTLNMVVTAQNRTEIEEMVDLATGLGARGVRFGHLMPTVDTALRGLDISPEERREVETRIWKLKKTASIFVGMAPGYYSESPFFPCGPLELEEFNLDCDGNFTLCCHLSGYSGPQPGTDLIASLRETSLRVACALFRERVEVYLADKRARVGRSEFGDLDHFPCWYCVKYLDKAKALEQMTGHSWIRAQETSERKA